jgi:hypothetical protein
MKILSILIAGASGAMIASTWGTPEAMAWTVAFCGWAPQCFNDDKETHGN